MYYQTWTSCMYNKGGIHVCIPNGDCVYAQQRLCVYLTGTLCMRSVGIVYTGYYPLCNSDNYVTNK